MKFITYDGIIEPIGNSQVLSYVKKLSKFYSIKILSYEKSKDLNNTTIVQDLKTELLKLNISWKPLRYRNYLGLLGTTINIFNGLIDNFLDLLSKKIIFFHIRGYVSGLLIIPFLFFFKIKFIFDMRGFWADERSDRLGWHKKKFKYRFFKKVEKKLLITSQSIICLTSDAKEIIINNYNIDPDKIFILPTYVDTNYFTLEKKIINENIKFCHFGSIESAYNINKTLKIFSFFLKIEKKIMLIFYTNQNTEYLKKLFLKYNIPKKNYAIYSLNKSQIVNKLNNIDIGIFYCNENFSIKGSYPTKIGEFLSCGVPIFCNSFNNDVTKLINKNKIGIISDFEILNYKQIFQEILKLNSRKEIRNHCRKIAISELSLEIGVLKIKNIYDNVW